MTEQISKQEIKKVYFGDKDPKADERMIEQGWTYAQDKFINEDNIERLEIPENCKIARLEPLIAGSDINQYIVWDPDLANAETVSLATPEGNRRWHELDALGYKVIESNIGRTIFVKSKVQMH